MRGPVSLATPEAAARMLMKWRSFAESVVRRFGVPKRDAPDIAQEALLQVLPWWRDRVAAEPDAQAEAARGYVRVTAMHCAVGHYHQGVRRAEQLEWESDDFSGGEAPGAATVESCRSPEDLWLEREAAMERAAEADLDRLSQATDPASWRAFHAYAVQGIPVKEIAEAEEAAVSTIYGRIRAARSDLRAAVLADRAGRRVM